jgi:predicted transcriptional regulator
MKMPTNTYLISVRPVWASAFFLSHNAKSIELRKGNFGTSLKPGDVIAIYATLPVGKLIGRVRVIKRESLTIDRLWQESQQGRLAKVSQAQFNAYYASQVFGVGVWVSAAELLPSPIALCRLRQNWGHRWQPPQQIQQLTDDQIEMARSHRSLNIDINERYVVREDSAACMTNLW